MTEFRFICFLLSRVSADRIVLELLKNKCSVAGAWYSNSPCLMFKSLEEHKVSQTLSLNVCSKKHTASNEFSSFINDLLKELRVPHYGIIVRVSKDVGENVYPGFMPEIESPSLSNGPYR